MMIPHRPPTGWIAVVALIATWTTLADPPRLTAQSGSGVGVEGPAPPVAPEVITRDDLGNATVRAVRLTQPIQLDGQLDEAFYQVTHSISDFIQSVPDEGELATERTEVWLAFDDVDIYVSARVWDSAPESEWVANELRRDTQQLRQNDTFGVMFDTFYDRRNGVILTVVCFH